MAAAACSDMNATCGQTRHGGQLLMITDSAVMEDAIALFNA